jgi:hypothetical protein
MNKSLIALSKVDISSKRDIICPVCGSNCNTTGLVVDHTGRLKPCDICQDNAYYEHVKDLDSLVSKM